MLIAPLNQTQDYMPTGSSEVKIDGFRWIVSAGIEDIGPPDHDDPHDNRSGFRPDWRG